MKKLLLFSTLLTLLLVTHVHGKTQTYRRSRSTQDSEKMKFGIKAKLHGAKFLPIPQEPGNIKDVMILRPSFDVFGEYGLNNTVGVQLSLGYSGQGNGISWNVGSTKCELKMSFNYIMLSIIPRFYPGSDQQFCFFIGPRISWLASAKVQVFVDGTKKGDAVDLLGDQMSEEAKPKRIDWGVLLGLDYEFDAGIILGVDSNVGLTSLWKDSDTSGRRRTFSIGASLGYNFAKLFN